MLPPDRSPNDTDRDARVLMDAVLRARSPRERLAMLDAMWVSAREMISHRLRTMHPEWDDDTLARETARRLSHGAF